MKSREDVVSNGRASFYASIYDDIRNAAMDCGWALGLHGSLSSDMDIMAMPWVEDAKPVEEMIDAIINCFTDNPFNNISRKLYYNKPNGRVVYTIHIWKDWYLDINVIQNNNNNNNKNNEMEE